MGRMGLANSDCPGGNPLAGVEQVQHQVIPRVSTIVIESSGDATANMNSEVFAQCKGGLPR